MKPYQSTTVIPLPEPEKILQRLSRHFRHKIPVEIQQGYSRLDFGIGICELRCTVAIMCCNCFSEKKEDLADIELTMERHLSNMAPLSSPIAWQPAHD